MKELLIECGAAETRAALVVDDEVRRFLFAPARGDEALRQTAQGGEVYLARIRTVSKPLNGAFVDIGDVRDGFLPFKSNATPPHEGAAMIVRIHRPALAQKGAVVAADWDKNLDADTRGAIKEKAKAAVAPVRLDAPRDAAHQILKAAGGRVDRIIIDRPEAASLLKEGANEISIETFPFAAVDADEALEEALAPAARFSGGGRLIVDETAGGAMVDIDAGSAAHGGAGPVNDKLNKAAARALFAELSRRAISGRIMVDFPPPSSAQARSALLQTLKRGAAASLGGRAGRLAHDGMFDMTAPRTGPSLLEHASVAAGEEWLRRGRRFTCDWMAKQAIRALETGLRRAPSSRPCLRVGVAIWTHLADHPQWRQRLAAIYSARFLIESDETLKERSYEFTE